MQKIDKFLNTKSLTSIAIPLVLIGIQALIRWVADADFSGLGITLSSIGIGQVFPFIVFESLLLSKIFGLKEESQYEEGGGLTLTYTVERKAQKDKITEIRMLSYLFFLINILLFIFTIVLNLKGQIILHIVTGALSCLIAWYYNIKY